MVHLVREMLHHLEAQRVFGGDLRGVTSAIQVITSKTESELPLIPTREQRSAVVTEVVQGVARAAGAATSEEEALAGAWRDLARSPAARNLALAELTAALERAALLRAMGAVRKERSEEKEEEVTVASGNIREFDIKRFQVSEFRIGLLYSLSPMRSFTPISAASIFALG